MPDDVVLSFKLALLVPSVRTPFALLIIAGAAVGAFGVLKLVVAEADIERDDRFNGDRANSLAAIAGNRPKLSPDEIRADLSWMENGYLLLLAGILMIAIGMIPFVCGREQ